MDFSRTRNAAAQRIATLVAMALLIASSHAFAAEAPLTLADAQRRAVERSRQLAAQDFTVAASREMAVAAAQLPDPVATLGIYNLPIDGPDAFSLTRDFMTMRSIGVMQEWTREEKRRAKADRFEREADRSLVERAARAAAIRRETALAWLDRYYAEAQSSLIAEQTRQSRLEVEAAETAYRTGRGNLGDVLAARSSLSALDDRASELGRRVGAAKIALARWVGQAAMGPLADKPPSDSVGLDPGKLDSELEHHPQIAALASQEEVAAAEVRLAQANKKADWSVQFMYSQRGPAYSNMVSLAVSVPLQWDHAHRQDRELAAKLALLDQARAEREDMLVSHVAEVRAMVAEWENDRERSARYERELVPLAAERTQAMLASYRGAKASIVDVLLARRGEIDIRLQALQLEAETARLWAQLNFLGSVDDAEMSTPNRYRKLP
ncbi:MAG TPA: TolC family protein [Casimicrobiaceae bacterium]|jgi:outer membrane protein TolC|nr:TolC family protein [Casimicrobiaceae bacterium]